jgi:hypothetical protein
LPRFRRPRLPPPPPRPLTRQEAAAIKARPWPRLPWWLWLSALVTAVAMVVIAANLARPPGQRRPPPGHGLTHDVGRVAVFALEPANAARVVRRQAGCRRLDAVTLVGTRQEVDLLDLAVDRLCALRSTPAIERARQGLQRARPLLAFATFERGGSVSTTVLDPGALPGSGGRVAVLVDGGFSVLPPERTVLPLVHEGTHLAAGGAPDAAGELDARLAELPACDALSAAQRRLQRDCARDDALRAEGRDRALDALRAEGYR